MEQREDKRAAAAFALRAVRGGAAAGEGRAGQEINGARSPRRRRSLSEPPRSRTGAGALSREGTAGWSRTPRWAARAVSFGEGGAQLSRARSVPAAFNAPRPVSVPARPGAERSAGRGAGTRRREPPRRGFAQLLAMGRGPA